MIRVPGRRTVAAAMICLLTLAGLVLAACDDGNGNAPADAPADTTRERATAAPQPTRGAAATPAEGTEVEVVGIVGAVSAADNHIEINRLSGADVDRIVVTGATRIQSASGNRLELGDLRPSDRIIATGVIDDGALTAAVITVQAGVPGASPGG